MGLDYDREKKRRRAPKKKPEAGANPAKSIDEPKRKSAGKNTNARNHSSAGKNANTRKRSGASRRRRRRNKKVDIISTVVLIAAVCVFVFSLYQLVMMLIPYYSGGQEYEKVKNLAVTVDDDGQGSFKVDFDALLKENPDTVAWLRFDQPEIISYPVVKSADNNEYLTKTFSANDNKLGAIFMDMRNNPGFMDRNTFIYGHNLKMGGEMFSQLNEYASEDFCKKNPYFYIYTSDGKTRIYQIFSAAVVKDTADSYEMTYATEQDYLDYLQKCKETSNYQVDVDLDVSSKIVSLSTCTNVRDDERFLVQGVLIEERG